MDAAGNVSAPTTTTWRVAAPALATHLTARLASTPAAVEQTAQMGVGCRFDHTAMTRCTVALWAIDQGHRMLVGRSSAAIHGSRGRTLKVKLNATGRRMLRHALGGLQVAVSTRAWTTTRSSLTASLTTRLYAHAPVVVPTVYFATNDASLGTHAHVQLAHLAGQVRKASMVRCVGYTDSQGNVASNLALGLRRATATCAALRALGVHAHVVTHTLGQDDARATNDTVLGRSLNRRVELHVTY